MMLNWFIDWRLKRLSIAHNKEFQAMLDVISKHGMKAHKYFPGVGQRDDVELSTALDWLAANGFVVTDRNGGIVGKVATANMDDSEFYLGCKFCGETLQVEDGDKVAEHLNSM